MNIFSDLFGIFRQRGLVETFKQGNRLTGFFISAILLIICGGGAMALAVESWANKGIWLVSRGTNGYPDRLQARLKSSAPPILYGVGNRELLNHGGFAIVGSRDVDQAGMEFTINIAGKCADQAIQIVSGGARGVDSEAMTASLSNGGSSIGVLAHSLTKAAVAGKYREHILDGNLTLISSYGPDSGISVGAAMDRNKHIYCLSNWALVVSSGLEKGGTWSGAVENIKRKWVPLFIRSGPSIPEGNKEPMKRGGLEIADSMISGDVNIRNWLMEHAEQFYNEENSKGQQLTLL